MQTFFCDKLLQKLKHIRWSRNKKELVAYENGPAKKLSKTAAFLTPSNTEGNYINATSFLYHCCLHLFVLSCPHNQI